VGTQVEVGIGGQHGAGLGHHPLTPAGDQSGHRDGPEMVGEAVQIDQQHDQTEGTRDPGHGDPDVRDEGVAHPPEIAERECERAGERREHGLLQPLAVPEPHEAR
jgi:hypothetical protein